LLPLIRRVNEIRRSNQALQSLANITFLETANDALIAYAKQTGTNTIICIVNLDPYDVQEGLTTVPAHLGLPPVFTVEDLLSGERFQWRIGPNYVRLEPGVRQGHISLVSP
jgi:starch synthase (maltosyl-transferring)